MQSYNSKFKNFFKNNQSGVATLEILIAMVVLVLALTTVILVLFGGQSVTTDTQTSQEAIYMAQKELEIIRAQSRGTSTQFNSIMTTSATVSGDIYTKQLTVVDISFCSKKVKSGINWSLEQRPQVIEITTVLTNLSAGAGAGGDCDPAPPSDPWRDPDTLGSEDISPAGAKGTDVDVLNKMVFLTAKHAASSSHDFYIINAIDSSNPTTASSLDMGPGLNAVDAAMNVGGTGKNFAFAASDDSSGQLQIIDVTDLNNPTVAASASLPGVNPAGSFPEGRAIFYHDAKVYIATWETAGPELHIFDVSTPTAPVWKGSRELNHSIRKIFVKGNYIYLATSGNQNELVILDISDPTSIQPPFPGVGNPEPWRFDAAGNEDGASIYVLGDKAYLGRKRGSSDELYVLDVGTPSAITSLGSKDIDLDPSTSEIVDIVVVADLAFLATGDSNEEFQVWNIAEPSNIIRYSTLNFPAKITGLDYEDDLVYSSVDSNDALRIIYDNP